jgi:hypothetical protein
LHSFRGWKGGYDRDPSQSIGEWRVGNGDTPAHLGRGGGGLQGPLVLVWRADRVVVGDKVSTHWFRVWRADEAVEGDGWR